MKEKEYELCYDVTHELEFILSYTRHILDVNIVLHTSYFERVQKIVNNKKHWY